MKKLNEVIQEHSEYAKIIRSVYRKIGRGSVAYVNEHGADAGYNGFIYYSDTVPFAFKYRKDIYNMLTDDAREFGYQITEMVKGFGAFPKYSKGDPKARQYEDEAVRDVFYYFAGRKKIDAQIPNLMAWYALETVCRWFE